MVFKTARNMSLRNFFKIRIPKDHAQEVTVLESYTVAWEVKTGWADATAQYHKVFIDINEAREFKKQVEESAKFINAWVSTSLYEN